MPLTKAAGRVPTNKIKAMIVDDSASVRMALTEILDADPDIEVIATAGDPFIAAQRLRKEVPDVIFLDIEMPRMDGLTFLRKIMAQRPIPVVICSTIAQAGSETFLEALAAGAVDIVPKPAINTAQALQETGDHIRQVARAAAHARLRGRSALSSPVAELKAADDAAPPEARAARATVPPIATETKLTADAVLPAEPRTAAGRVPHTDPLVCIGASTGGTEAIRVVLEALTPDCPGIVIVQHMPERFTEAFARRLDKICAVAVKEAEHGDQVLPGRVLIAPGGHHLAVVRAGTRDTVKILDGPPVSRHRPSVDVLFRSAAQQAGGNALGILLTGMGDDGARGLLELRRSGGATIAQDEDSSVVFGMPKEAIARGAAGKVQPLGRMARDIMAHGHGRDDGRNSVR
jgi:two-component system chemotaxis response regulator CheB